MQEYTVFERTQAEASIARILIGIRSNWEATHS